MLEHGLDATTTDAVLSETGLSKGAMYHHFRSKTEIIEAVYRMESHGANGSTDTSSVDGDAGSTGLNGSISAGSFAVGSGAYLTSKDYGNPFQSGVGAVCSVYKNSTKGPCHSNTYLRKDITDGLVGLPTRFEFVIVDSACNPVPNAFVEIWYASPAGTYSQAAEAIDSGVGYNGSLSDLNACRRHRDPDAGARDREVIAADYARGGLRELVPIHDERAVPEPGVDAL